MELCRKISTLNSGWKFLKDDEAMSWYKGFDDSLWRSVTVPHDWSVEEPFSEKYSSGTGYLPGGVGWYRNTFSLSQNLIGKKVYITFGGIYNNSQVWCNSYYLGKRPYGYSSFTYDISSFVNREDSQNVISVRVNHKDIADSRWFTGSGIYRDVNLTITNNIHIDNYGLFAATSELSREKAVVSVKVNVLNETGDNAVILIKNTLVDTNKNKVAESMETLTINGESSLEIEQKLDVMNPETWSPNSPQMYSLVTEIIKEGIAIDDIVTSIGIRSISFDSNKGFFLNGINMKIKGVCLHHDAGCLGAAVPKKVWKRRLKLLKDMGCNAIRMSHNPPDPKLLDLCDSMGFLVIDEAFDEWEGVKNKWSTGHNIYPPKHFGYSEDFIQWHETDIKEMVLRDRNHPSIILWSIGNEVDYPNDPYCHPSFKSMTGNNDANKPSAEMQYNPDKPNSEHLTVIAKRLVEFVKECDTTRPVTAAIAFPELSNLIGYTDVLDVVGYNYKENLYDEDHIKYPSKVIFGSENGPGFDKWLAVRNNDNVCAQFIWSGIDFMGEAKGWPIRISQSGFLNLAGFKKVSYYFRKSLWVTEPFVFLASKKKDETKAVPHWNWVNGENIRVFCYTNCDKVELFLNDHSLGIKRLEDFSERFITWDIEYKSGTLKAAAVNKNKEECVFEIKTASFSHMISISSDSEQLKADGQDIAHIEIQITDSMDNLVYLSDNVIELNVEGPGVIIGMENGDPEDLEPYSSRSRHVLNGKLLAYLRTTQTAGDINISSESNGLKSGKLQIRSL